MWSLDAQVWACLHVHYIICRHYDRQGISHMRVAAWELMEATHKAHLMRPCVAMHNKMMIYDITTGCVNNIDM